MILRPRLAWSQQQDSPEESDNERALADRDLTFLLSYLTSVRGRDYELLERPDETARRTAAADYLVLEHGGGRRIAIEHTRFIDQHLHATKSRAIKAGGDLLFTAPASLDAARIGEQFTAFLTRKLRRHQLKGIHADETILLIRNRVLATANTYLRMELELDPGTKSEAHACYVIVSSKLIQIW